MIVGPTAVGKSGVAMALARLDPRFEIVSADSMQVYRGMDIGTAKPSPAEQGEVQHHLIDIVDPHQDFGVAQFQQAAGATLTEIAERGNRALIVGGTGLYIRAVVDALDIPGQYPDVRAELEAVADTRQLHRRLAVLDPLAASRMEPTNRRRVARALEVAIGSGRPFSSFGPGLIAYPQVSFRQVGIDRTREELDKRIAQRYGLQMAAGFLDEVRRVAARPEAMSRTARQALGYKELLTHLEGFSSLERALDLANTRTRRFARRQQRWFRRDPRILWLDGNMDAVALAEEILRTHPHSESG